MTQHRETMRPSSGGSKARALTELHLSREQLSGAAELLTTLDEPQQESGEGIQVSVRACAASWGCLRPG